MKYDTRETQGVNYWPWVSLVIAISPAIGYIVAYVYERNYFDYFGIPQEFIIINWASLFVGIGGFSSFALILFLTIKATNWFFASRIILSRVFLIFCTVIYAFLIVIRYSVSNQYVFLLYFVPLFFIFTELIAPLIDQRKTKGYRAKLIRARRKSVEKFPKIPYPLRKILMWVLPAILVLTTVALFEGERAAVIKNEFIFLSNHPRVVVLKAYKDYLICTPINADNTTFKRNFIIIPVLNESGIILSPEKIGPLKPE